jgi:hypothetical protein
MAGGSGVVEGVPWAGTSWLIKQPERRGGGESGWPRHESQGQEWQGGQSSPSHGRGAEGTGEGGVHLRRRSGRTWQQGSH